MWVASQGACTPKKEFIMSAWCYVINEEDGEQFVYWEMYFKLMRGSDIFVISTAPIFVKFFDLCTLPIS